MAILSTSPNHLKSRAYTTSMTPEPHPAVIPQSFKSSRSSNSPNPPTTNPAIHFMTDPVFDPAEFKALSSGIGLGTLKPKIELKKSPVVASTSQSHSNLDSTTVNSAQMQAAELKLQQTRGRLISVNPSTANNLFAAQMSSQPAAAKSVGRTLRALIYRSFNRLTPFINLGIRKQLNRIMQRLNRRSTHSSPSSAETKVRSLTPPNSSSPPALSPNHTLHPLKSPAAIVLQHSIDFGLAFVIFNGVLASIIVRRTTMTFTESLRQTIEISWWYNLAFAYGFLIMIYGISWAFKLPTPAKILWQKLAHAPAYENEQQPQ